MVSPVGSTTVVPPSVVVVVVVVVEVGLDGSAGIVMMIGAGGRVSKDLSLIVKPKAGDCVLPEATDAVMAM